MIRSLQISAPDILKELITSKRNQLEHEYNKPEEWKQINYVADIVELFLKASDSIVIRGHLRSIQLVCKSNVSVISETRYKKAFQYDEEETVFEFGLKDYKLSATSYKRHITKEVTKQTGGLKGSLTPKQECGKASYNIGDFDDKAFKELISLLYSESSKG